MNKAIIQRYFDAYNNKNETIFDEIISSDYIDHGQSAYMGSPGRGIDGAKNDLRYSLDKLDLFLRIDKLYLLAIDLHILHRFC